MPRALLQGPGSFLTSAPSQNCALLFCIEKKL